MATTPRPSAKPSLFAALFGGKVEATRTTKAQSAAVPARSPLRPPDGRRPRQIRRCRAVPRAKPRPPRPSSWPRPTPRSCSRAKASAGRNRVRLGRPKPKPQTPADIINARGFWGDAPATPKQATPAQVAAISARQALASADPQSTASVAAAFQAMAYAPPASSPVDRANIVAASAPIPRSSAPPRAAQSGAADRPSTPSLPRGRRVRTAVVATSTRIAAVQGQRPPGCGS